MKAVRSIDGTPQLVDVPAPEPSSASASAPASAPAPDPAAASAKTSHKIRVKIQASGICGSDLHMLDMGIFNPEITIGHEFAGLTDDGTPVAVEPVSSCGACIQCDTGDYNLCHRATVDVLGFGQDGGMAEQALVSPHQLVHLPASVPVQDACLVEPLAVCVRALRLAGFGGGHRGSQRVAVIGGGNIGLCAAAVVRHFGAPVTVLARHPAQLEAAARLGADTPDNPDDPSEIPDSSFDIVVDAAGTASALQLAGRLTAPAGAISLVSTYWEGLELPGYEVCTKEIRLIPSIMYGRHAGGRDADSAAAVLSANPEVARAIITHRFPLDAVDEAFATARDRAAGAIKVVLEP